MRKLLLFVPMALFFVMPLWAQHADSAAFRVGGYALIDGHIASGTTSGVALFVGYQRPLVDMSLGAEIVTTSRIALDFRTKVQLHQFRNGELYGQNRYLYRQFWNIDLQEFTGALQLGWSGRHFDCEFGFGNRYMAALVQREDGGTGTVFEPLNVLFAAEYWVLNEQSSEKQVWNIGLRWSNYNDFVVERVADWFYSLKAYYRPQPNFALTLEAGFHPTGSLNLTSSYDGWFAHLGANYCF